MTGTKKEENWTDIKKEEKVKIIKQIFWSMTSSGYKSEQDVIDKINSGVLGFKIVNKKEVPITISRATYFTYKKTFMQKPEIYEDIRHIALNAFDELLNGFIAEMKDLHSEATAIKNDTSLKPMQKLRAIQIICKDILPTRSALVDIAKTMYQKSHVEPKKEESQTAV